MSLSSPSISRAALLCDAESIGAPFVPKQEKFEAVQEAAEFVKQKFSACASLGSVRLAVFAEGSTAVGLDQQVSLEWVCECVFIRCCAYVCVCSGNVLS